MTWRREQASKTVQQWGAIICQSMVTCRHNTSYPVIYSYNTITTLQNITMRSHTLQIHPYTEVTQDDGIVNWQDKLRKDLPRIGPKPQYQDEQYHIEIPQEYNNVIKAYYDCIDSDWVGCHTTSKSVSGIVILMAVAVVVSKIILQRTTVALYQQGQNSTLFQNQENQLCTLH